MNIYLLLWIVTMFLCLSGCAPFWFLTQKHYALSWPVSLAQEPSDSPIFETKFGQRRYEIWLRSKRTIPLQDLDCYMGMNHLPNQCAQYPNQINIRWQIFGDGKLVTSGVETEFSGGSWTNKYIERIFGSFDAIEGVKYQMKIEVLRDGTLLNPAEPSFQIYACYNPANKSLTCRP